MFEDPNSAKAVPARRWTLQVDRAYGHVRGRAGETAALVTIAVALTITYWDVGARLARQWVDDSNYSHGVLIGPLALLFAWQRRAALREVPRQPSAWGLVVTLASLSMLVAGKLSAELFLARASLIGVLAGATLFLLSPRHLRLLAFPLAFLFFMIPLPTLVFNQIALPLQLVASQVGEVAIRVAGVPVLRQGNILELAPMRLEVAEACSGIRSLVSLMACAVVVARFGSMRHRDMALLVAATIPVAIGTNAMRVAITGLSAHFLGRGAAEGFFHTFSGPVVFTVAISCLLVLDRRLRPAGTGAAS